MIQDVPSWIGEGYILTPMAKVQGSEADMVICSAVRCNASGNVVRCPANVPHVRQSRPDSGPGLQVKGLKTFPVVPISQGSEADMVICSAVRCNASGNVDFLFARCRGNMAQTRQSGPDFGLDFQVKGLLLWKVATLSPRRRNHRGQRPTW